MGPPPPLQGLSSIIFISVFVLWTHKKTAYIMENKSKMVISLIFHSFNSRVKFITGGTKFLRKESACQPKIIYNKSILSSLVYQAKVIFTCKPLEAELGTEAE